MLWQFRLSVYLSVCLCVTCMLYIKTAKLFVKILLPPDSHIILVFRYRGSLLNSGGFTLNQGTEYKGWENWVIFDRKVGVSGKWCEIWPQLLQKSNRKPYPSHRMVPLPMTLSDPNPQFECKYLTNMTSHGFLSDSWARTCCLVSAENYVIIKDPQENCKCVTTPLCEIYDITVTHSGIVFTPLSQWVMTVNEHCFHKQKRKWEW